MPAVDDIPENALKIPRSDGSLEMVEKYLK